MDVKLTGRMKHMCSSYHAAVHCVQHAQSRRQLGGHAEQTLEYARLFSVPARCLEDSRLTSAVSIEFSLAICVACLPALAPFFKRFAALASLIPSIRSRFTSRSSAAEKDGAWRARKMPSSRSRWTSREALCLVRSTKCTRRGMLREDGKSRHQTTMNGEVEVVRQRYSPSCRHTGRLGIRTEGWILSRL